MAYGIIYVMETVVPGLVKIGKTGIDQFKNRMNNLEKNGYGNVTGLKRRFAIEVEDYDDKEKLIDDIFSKSRVGSSELFAIDISLVIQLLSSFEGRKAYPKEKSKEEVFESASRERAVNLEYLRIPDGMYYLSLTRKGFGTVKAQMSVESGAFTLLKGSECAPPTKTQTKKTSIMRQGTIIINNILQEDFVCSSPSQAGQIACGRSINGWKSWVDSQGDYIDKYRSSEEGEIR